MEELPRLVHTYFVYITTTIIETQCQNSSHPHYQRFTCAFQRVFRSDGSEAISNQFCISTVTYKQALTGLHCGRGFIVVGLIKD